MKAALILTTLLGSAIASPVAIANVEAIETEKRDLEPRQFGTLPFGSLAGLPVSTAISNGGGLNGIRLVVLPNNNVTTTSANFIPKLTMFVAGFYAALSNLDTGLGGVLGVVPVPGFPNNIGPSIPSGQITNAQLLGLVDALNVYAQGANALGLSPPANLNQDQVKQALALFYLLQQGFIPLQKLPTVTSPGGVSGSAAALAPLLSTGTSTSGIISNLSNTLTSLIGGVLGGVLGGGLGGGGGASGILSGILGGNLLTGLLGSLPVISALTSTI